MSLTTNTSLIPGTTIVTDSITGGIAILQNNNFVVVGTNGSTTNNQSNFNALSNGNVITFSTQLTNVSTGFFVTGTGIPSGTYITQIYTSSVTVGTPPSQTTTTYYNYQLNNSVTIPGTNLTVTFTSPLVVMAANSIAIANNTTTIANNTTTMTTLAQGTGIHTAGAYDWLGYASLYHLYVEQGKLNVDTSTNVSAADQAAALAILESYRTKLNSLPQDF